MNLMPVMRPKGGKVKNTRAHSPVRCRFNHLSNMFKSIFAAAALLWSTVAYAQLYTIHGQVKRSDTNQSLPSATLEIKELNRHVVADEFGNYHFTRIPPGEYTVS